MLVAKGKASKEERSLLRAAADISWRSLSRTSCAAQDSTGWAAGKPKAVYSPRDVWGWLADTSCCTLVSPSTSVSLCVTRRTRPQAWCTCLDGRVWQNITTSDSLHPSSDGLFPNCFLCSANSLSVRLGHVCGAAAVFESRKAATDPLLVQLTLLLGWMPFLTIFSLYDAHFDLRGLPSCAAQAARSKMATHIRCRFSIFEHIVVC